MRLLGKLGLVLAGGLLLVVIMGMTLRPSLKPWPEAPTLSSHEGSLRLRFLGTSSISLEDDEERILLDGYFSRPGLAPLLLRPLQPDQQRVSDALFKAGIDNLSAILVAHAHFDHALDVSTLAKRFNASIIGSSTIKTIMHKEGSGAHVQVPMPGQTFRVGQFQITPISVPHAPGDVARGSKAEDFRFPARAHKYPMGEAYAFLITREQCRILIVPSAGQPDNRLAGIQADVVLIGIGQLASQGISSTETYWRDTVRTTGAKVAIPIHWDDFTRSLDKPLRPMPYAIDRMDMTMERLTVLAQKDGVSLKLPPAYIPMDLAAMGASHCA